MSAREFAAYSAILLLADKATGVWWGCSLALSAQFGDGSLDSRAAKDALHSLETKGYIKRFRTHGQRGNHPILIDKFLVSYGGLSGKLVNASKSKSYEGIVYEARTEQSTDERPDNRTDSRPLSIPDTRNQKQIERKNGPAVASETGTGKTSNPEIPVDAKELTRQLANLLGSPDDLNNPAIVSAWQKQSCQALNQVSDPPALTRALNWVFSAQDGNEKNPATFWHRQIVGASHPMAMIAKHADKLVTEAAAAARKEKLAALSKKNQSAQSKPDAYTARKMKVEEI
jgi:hypothetical protein